MEGKRSSCFRELDDRRLGSRGLEIENEAVRDTPGVTNHLWSLLFTRGSPIPSLRSICISHRLTVRSEHSLTKEDRTLPRPRSLSVVHNFYFDLPGVTRKEVGTRVSDCNTYGRRSKFSSLLHARKYNCTRTERRAWVF